jgi:hypothetical protein
MGSKKPPEPAQEKPVPDATPEQSSPPPPPAAPTPEPDETIVLQDRIAHLASGRVVRATAEQAKSLMSAGRARKATTAQIANQAGRVPALPADTPLTQTEKD